MSRQLMASDGPLDAARRGSRAAAGCDGAARSARPALHARCRSARRHARPVALVLAADADERCGRRAASRRGGPRPRPGTTSWRPRLPRVEEAAQLWLRPRRLRGARSARCSGCATRAARARGAPPRRCSGSRGRSTATATRSALAERHALAAEYGDFLARHPLILGPVSTCAPWPVGHDLGGAERLRDEWWGFRLTVATACLGLPAVSVPAGLDARGRPVGVQLVAARWREGTLAGGGGGDRVGPRDAAQRTENTRGVSHDAIRERVHPARRRLVLAVRALAGPGGGPVESRRRGPGDERALREREHPWAIDELVLGLTVPQRSRSTARRRSPRGSGSTRCQGR